MMADIIFGFISDHSSSSTFFVTVTKSGPKNTLETPLILKSDSASGDAAADRGFAKSLVPLSNTGRPG